MIRRAEAITIVLAKLRDEVAITANGWISREACAIRDRAENFYMLGSMGQASPIGLGVALARPERRVVVFDGDGNLLMTMGSLAMVGAQKPRNFIHIVFDNERYGSTGGQRSLSAFVALEKVAYAAGYVRAERAVDAPQIEAAIGELFAIDGPSFLLIKVAPEADGEAPRVPIEPPAIADRLRRALAGRGEG